jgi:hypothetical protein
MNRWIVILLLFAVGTLATLEAAQRGGGGIRKKYGGLDDPIPNRALMDYAGVWRSFKSDTEDLQKTLGAKNAEAATLLAQIQTNALFLKTKWDAWFSKHNRPGTYVSGDEYLSALRADDRMLGRIKKEKDEQKALSALRDVALDLQVKADNCRNSGDGLGKEIKVKVHTKADEKEVGGYEVFYVPKGMFDVKSAHDRFPRQSSPTDEKILCPGAYAMWVRKKTFTSEPVTLRIGGRGETRLEVDLEVPAP